MSGTTTHAQDILPAEYEIPGPIHEYLSNIGTSVTPGGQVTKVNVPDALLSQPDSEDDQEEEIASGIFGMPDDEIHTAYEANVCPYTTFNSATRAPMAGFPPPGSAKDLLALAP